MCDIKTVQLHFYIANNFGIEHQNTFADLTNLLITCANTMTANGILLMSPYFQQTLVRESLMYLKKHYPDHKFEHFFQTIEDDNCYLIINNIHKHPTLDTVAGQYMYDHYLYYSVNQ